MTNDCLRRQRLQRTINSSNGRSMKKLNGKAQSQCVKLTTDFGFDRAAGRIWAGPALDDHDLRCPRIECSGRGRRLADRAARRHHGDPFGERLWISGQQRGNRHARRQRFALVEHKVPEPSLRRLARAAMFFAAYFSRK